ncbi:hypothetical protein [Mycobacteroides abscessus]
MSNVYDTELINRVATSTGLPMNVATRVVDDVIAFYRQPASQYVRQRHAELQTEGYKNPQIFTVIADELTRRLVAAPTLTERQLRRIVYG